MSASISAGTSEFSNSVVAKKRQGPLVIVALDVADIKSCDALLDKLDPAMCRVKIGKELFTRSGPQQVEAVIRRGFDVFLDLKFHDIPNTVAGACRAASDLGVWMVNVHAAGGSRMLEAARQAVPEGGSTRLIAVTVLTSLEDADLQKTGVANASDTQVELLAKLTRDCGLDGVVCSARESAMLKTICGDNFLLVTPGVRPNTTSGLANSAADQRRIMTPEDAIKAGSTHLVIGRPITRAEDPAAVVQQINKSIE